MRAGVYDFSFLVNQSQLEIPLFQPEYSWEKLQWRRFLTELRHAFDHNSSHFLGTLLLKNLSNRPTRLLLDGEQRVTTFAILLKALFDQLNHQEDADLIAELKNILFQNNEDRTPKIIHSKLNQRAFGIVFSVDKSENILNVELTQRPIIECYRYFSKHIKKIDSIYLRHFLKFLLSAKIWVILDLEETDNAQIVFDTVNFAHEQSAAAQIIQNNLFYRIMEICDKNDFGEFYEKFWHAIFEKDEETYTFWHGRDKRGYPQIEGFLKVFAIVAGFFDPEKNVFNDLSATYDKKFNIFKSKEELQNFLNFFKEYALLWFEWGSLEAQGKGFEDFECRLFQIVHLTELSLLPLILKLKYILKGNREELKNVFDFLSGILCQTYINKNMILTTNAEYFELMKNLDEKMPFEYLKNHFSNKRKTQPAKKMIVKRVMHK